MCIRFCNHMVSTVSSVQCLQNDSGAARFYQRCQLLGSLTLSGSLWTVLVSPGSSGRCLGKGGTNLAALGPWLPWTEVPEASQKNDISLTFVKEYATSLGLSRVYSRQQSCKSTSHTHSIQPLQLLGIPA